MSPQPKTKVKPVIEAILPNAEAKTRVIRYVEDEEAGQDVTNIYVKKEGLKKLGNPKAVKVTVEAYDPDE